MREAIGLRTKGRQLASGMLRHFARPGFTLALDALLGSQYTCLGTMRRIVVVEDEAGLRRAICRVLKEWSANVEQAATREEAMRLLHTSPDLLVIDIRLPDGSGLEIARAAADLKPKPAILAISGAATAEEAFELARIGVRGFLPKPLSLEGLRPTIQSILDHPAPLDTAATAFVGIQSIHDVQSSVRRSMVWQALSMTKGNRSEAARLLGVTRQAVQHMIRDLEIAVPDTFEAEPKDH